MPIPKKIMDYLKENKVDHEVVKHKTVYTAYDLAHTLAEKLNKVAKTLVVKVDKDYRLVVLPAHLKVDLDKLKKALKARVVELVPEKTMEKIFKVKNGLVTPFGSLHKAEVLIDKALIKSKDVVVRAGSLTEALRMKAKDLHHLEKATLGDFSMAVKKKVGEVASKIAKKMKKSE